MTVNRRPRTAHIHIAPVTDLGPVVVPIATPTDGDSSGCVDITRELAPAGIRNPAPIVVNVHNADSGSAQSEGS